MQAARVSESARQQRDSYEVSLCCSSCCRCSRVLKQKLRIPRACHVMCLRGAMADWTAALMQALAHQRRGQAMREALDKQQTSSWREFQAVASVLIAAGALEPDTYRVSLHCTVSPAMRYCQLEAVSAAAMHPKDMTLSLVLDAIGLRNSMPGCKFEADGVQATSLGEVARQVSGENELWLATALTHAALQVRSPSGHKPHLQKCPASQTACLCIDTTC